MVEIKGSRRRGGDSVPGGAGERGSVRGGGRGGGLAKKSQNPLCMQCTVPRDVIFPAAQYVYLSR